MAAETEKECLEKFQTEVGELLIRNSNILDIMTKIQISCAKLCRSTVKSATGCGCTHISAAKAEADAQLFLPASRKTGIGGALCGECRDIVESEIGETLFYIASLCNALGLSLEKIAERETKNMNVLGKYNLR